MASQRQKYIEKALADPRNLDVEEFIKVAGVRAWIPAMLLHFHALQNCNWVLINKASLKYIGYAVENKATTSQVTRTVNNTLISKPRFEVGRDYVILDFDEFSSIWEEKKSCMIIHDLRKSNISTFNEIPTLRTNKRYTIVSIRTLKTLCMIVSCNSNTSSSDEHLNHFLDTEDLFTTYIEYQRECKSREAIESKNKMDIALHRMGITIQKLDELKADTQAILDSAVPNHLPPRRERPTSKDHYVYILEDTSDAGVPFYVMRCQRGHFNVQLNKKRRVFQNLVLRFSIRAVNSIDIWDRYLQNDNGQHIVKSATQNWFSLRNMTIDQLKASIKEHKKQIGSRGLRD